MQLVKNPSNYLNTGISRRALFSDTIRMAWPTMLESFLVSITVFVDTIMVSSLGIAAVAAIGLSSQPKFIGLCAFFAMATAISAIVARRRGENDRQSANKVLRASLLVGVVLVVITSVAFYFGADAIIAFSGSTEETHADAVRYLQIIMSGIGFTVMTLLANAAQRGAGKAKISMVTNITSNVVNMMFNYLLIGGNFGFPALGVEGAAYATVIGSAVGFIISIISLMRKNEFITLRAIKGFIPTKRDVDSYFKVGSSAFVEQIMMRIGFFLFFLSVSNLGTIPLGAHQIGMNFMGISFSFADGLSIASVALVGRSLGAKKPEFARAYSIACQSIGFVCSLGVMLVCVFFGRDLFGLFSDDAEVLSYAVTLMLILSGVTFLQIQQVTIFGCLRGAGDTKYTAIVSTISVAIIRPLASYILCYPLGLGLLGVWLGLTFDQLLRYSLGLIRFKRGKWLELKI